MKDNFKINLAIGILLTLVISVSCNKDDDNNQRRIQFRLNNYFSVTNGDPFSFRYPASSDTSARPSIDSIIGEQVFPNGELTTIDVYLSELSTSVIVGIDTISGYYQVFSETPKDLFSLNFDFSNEPAERVYQLVFAAIDEDNFISETEKLKIITVEGVIGELEVVAEWDNPVDIDLLLEEPNGEVIFYDNRLSENLGRLNRDSNPFCWLDSLNEETIFYDDGGAIEIGTYKVSARFLSSCDISDSTTLSVSIKFNGELMELETTPNPFTKKLGADEIDTEPFDLFDFNVSSGLKSTASHKLLRVVYPNETKEESRVPKKREFQGLYQP